MWRGAARLVPAGRRDWVEAVWAEAPEVPPGLRRLAWRAGGVRLIAREATMRRGIGSAMLFAAAAVAAWTAWPGSSASFATSVDRVYVITMVLLAGLPLLARPFLGPTGDSRASFSSWPWETQPGSAGHSATILPSSACCNVT